MTDFPLLINFSVLHVNASEDVIVTDSIAVTKRRLSLVLQARRDCEIQLSSGENLSTVDLHLTIVSGSPSEHGLGVELEGNLGFLVHSRSYGGEPPLVHGAVVWASGSLPYYLLTQGLTVHVRLGISSLHQDHEEPYIWPPGNESFLRISDYSISCTNAQNL